MTSQKLCVSVQRVLTLEFWFFKFCKTLETKPEIHSKISKHSLFQGEAPWNSSFFVIPLIFGIGGLLSASFGNVWVQHAQLPPFSA